MRRAVRKNTRARRVRHVILAVWLTLMLGAIAVFGYYFEKEYLHDALPFSAETIGSAVYEQVRAGKSTRTLVFGESVSPAQMDAAMQNVYDTSGTVLYATDSISYTIATLLGHSRVTVQVQYIEGRTDVASLPEATGPQELENLIIAAAEAGEEEVAVHLTAPELTTQEAVSLCGDAVINAFLPCEVSQYETTLYPDAGNDRVAQFHFTYPVDATIRTQLSEELETEMQRMVNAILAQGITEPEELYRAAHDAVIDAGEYDYEGYNATLGGDVPDDMRITRSAYGLMVRGKTVCSGYAYTFKELCDRLGLPCWVITGHYGDEVHAWNAVQLNGETRIVDCTFDDTGGIRYASFLLTPGSERAAQYRADDGSVPPWERVA